MARKYVNGPADGPPVIFGNINSSNPPGTSKAAAAQNDMSVTRNPRDEYGDGGAGEPPYGTEKASKALSESIDRIMGEAISESSGVKEFFTTARAPKNIDLNHKAALVCMTGEGAEFPTTPELENLAMQGLGSSLSAAINNCGMSTEELFYTVEGRELSDFYKDNEGSILALGINDGDTDAIDTSNGIDEPAIKAVSDLFREVLASHSFNERLEEEFEGYRDECVDGDFVSHYEYQGRGMEPSYEPYMDYDWDNGDHYSELLSIINKCAESEMKTRWSELGDREKYYLTALNYGSSDYVYVDGMDEATSEHGWEIRDNAQSIVNKHKK